MSTAVTVFEDEGTSEDEMAEQENSYESLGPRLASSANLISSVSQIYLDPRISETSRSCSHARKRSSHRRHKRRPRRHSERSRETDELDYNFNKMKMWMFILACMYVVLLVVFLLTHPKIGPFFHQEIPEGLNLCVKCADLKSKVGSADLLETLQSPNYPSYCCFKTMDQLLNLVEWYAHDYTQQVITKVKDRYPIVNNTRFPSIEPSAAHMYVKQSGGKLSFVRTGIDVTESVTVGTYLTEYRNATMQIKEDGYYFIYSRLLFTGSNYNHRVNYKKLTDKDSSPFLEEKQDSYKSDRVVSLLHGMKRLDANSTLSLGVDGTLIQKDGRENYFGLYKIGKI